MSKQNDRDSIVDLLKQYLGLEDNDTERLKIDGARANRF